MQKISLNKIELRKIGLSKIELTLLGSVDELFTSIYVENDLGVMIEYPFVSTFSAGRYNYDGDVFLENKPVTDDIGILTYDTYEQLALYSEDTSNWTGSGPWTQSVTLADTGTYTISTNLSGATIDVTAGTATIDAVAQATYGVADQFVVSGAGTVTVTTDTADAKVQLTKTLVAMPYIKTTTASITIPVNYSDATHGSKVAIEGALLDILTDAEGIVEFGWTPAFSHTDVAVAGSIISIDNNTPGWLYYNTTGGLVLTDGVETCTVDIDFVAGATYSICANWGTHPTDGAGKMWITVTHNNQGGE